MFGFVRHGVKHLFTSPHRISNNMLSVVSHSNAQTTQFPIHWMHPHVDPIPVDVYGVGSLTRVSFSSRPSRTKARDSSAVHAQPQSRSVRAYDSIEDLGDESKLSKLLENAFGKKLKEEYLDLLRQNLLRLYVAGWDQNEYDGCAVITDEGVDMPYLDKFAVSNEARGKGVGGILWKAVRRDMTGLFWRSRSDNKVNGWYFNHSHGSMQVTPEAPNATPHSWTAFWVYGNEYDDVGGAKVTLQKDEIGRGGKGEMERIAHVVELVKTKPLSFHEKS